MSAGKENQTGLTKNRVWDGQVVNIFGAHNEIVSFNLILEAGSNRGAANVTVLFNDLVGPTGAHISSQPSRGTDVFDWRNRNIELFYARYLQIKGLSYFGYNKWDERQVPVRMARPHLDNGIAYGAGGWYDRPDHDKFYPDPLVPMEVIKQFNIAPRSSQSVWVDIYIPKDVPTGVYTGIITVSEEGTVAYQVPVSLSVYNFSLPDTPSAKTMAVLSTRDIMWRYVSAGQYKIWSSPDGQRAANITDKYYQLFHRHKIALVGENECPIVDRPCDSSLGRLSGALYTADKGYDGPGRDIPNGVFSIGTYGTWAWGDEASMWRHADAWSSWFSKYLPGTDYFLYLKDEPGPQYFGQVDMWARWLKENPGPGRNLLSAVTTSPVIAQTEMPNVNIPIMPADTGLCYFQQITCDNRAIGEATAKLYKNSPSRRYWAYNDGRPATGSAMTEDDGIGMRVLGWTQMKMGIDRWYYWFVNPDDTKNLFQDAVTYGTALYRDFSNGMSGGDGMSNGNGLLVYPGTDLFNPGDSYGLDGPIASLRLKEWRRGLQDADYIALASRVDASRAAEIVGKVLPRTLWEVDAPEPAFYTGGGPSWSSDPDTWESARAELADLIANACIAERTRAECSVATSANESEPSNTKLPLTVTSTVPGASFVIVGTGCDSGYHTTPAVIQVADRSLCMISVAAPQGFSFSGWSDTAAPNPRSIVMSSDIQTLVAKFTLTDRSSVAVTITGAIPNATVTVAGQYCTVGGAYSLPVTWALPPGVTCNLTADVPAGYLFKQWSNGSFDRSFDLTVPNSSTALNVTYEQIASSKPNSPSITVTSVPSGVSFLSFGAGCSIGLYKTPSTLETKAGAVCSLTPVTPDGMSFEGWSDGDKVNPRTILVLSQPTFYEMRFR